MADGFVDMRVDEEEDRIGRHGQRKDESSTDFLRLDRSGHRRHVGMRCVRAGRRGSQVDRWSGCSVVIRYRRRGIGIFG